MRVVTFQPGSIQVFINLLCTVYGRNPVEKVFYHILENPVWLQPWRPGFRHTWSTFMRKWMFILSLLCHCWMVTRHYAVWDVSDSLETSFNWCRKINIKIYYSEPKWENKSCNFHSFKKLNFYKSFLCIILLSVSVLLNCPGQMAKECDHQSLLTFAACQIWCDDTHMFWRSQSSLFRVNHRRADWELSLSLHWFVLQEKSVHFSCMIHHLSLKLCSLPNTAIVLQAVWCCWPKTLSLFYQCTHSISGRTTMTKVKAVHLGHIHGCCLEMFCETVQKNLALCSWKT